jgi:fluoride exporter
MQAILIVFLGAGAGGALRHLINVYGPALWGREFPWSTALINVSGSLAMGLLIGYLALRSDGSWPQSFRLFLATGVLGGYTTFSTFSLDALVMIERGQMGAAAAYVGGSVALGLLGLWTGLLIMRSLP